MTLAVHILDVVPGKWGFTTVGGWAHPVNDFLGTRDTGSFLLWDLDGEAMTGGDQYGHTVKLSPFMGVLGMPPAEPGMHSTVPPRITGGNLDCKELIAGSTLYLPIAVSGGLFSTGDGHARQGDGESSGTAIECPIARADLRFELLDRPALSTPCAQTPLGWLTFGLDEDLDQAALIALAAMVDLMIERFGLSRHQALGLASVVVDLRITQIVNGTKGVHAALSFESIDELGLEPV
jgi:acetamidase/formamidase